MIYVWEKNRRFYNPSARIFGGVSALFMFYSCKTLTPIPPLLVSEPDQKIFYEKNKNVPELQPDWVKKEREFQNSEQEKGKYAPYFEDTELALVIEDEFCWYNIWDSPFVLTYKLLISWYATRYLDLKMRDQQRKKAGKSSYDLLDEIIHGTYHTYSKPLIVFLSGRAEQINFDERARLSANSSSFR